MAHRWRSIAAMAGHFKAVNGFGFGTAELGNLYRDVSEHEARGALEAAWDNGIRFFDTSPFYGAGLSELRLGAFLRSLPRGSEYTLATKVGRWLRRPVDPAYWSPFAAGLPFEPVFDYSYDGAMKSFEQSVQRLGILKPGILFIHDLDRRNHGDQFEARYAEAREGCFAALTELKRAGDIEAIGIAINEADTGTRMLADGDFDCALLAGRYTLLEQSALHQFLPAAARSGVEVCLGGVFNSGILASGARNGAVYDYQAAGADVLERVTLIESVCVSHGVPIATAALQFAAAHPGVAAVLIGSSRAARITANIEALSRPLPPALWDDLRTRGLIDAAAPVPASPA
jgi:D-threo-aldose 1-dehydrogenase